MAHRAASGLLVVGRYAALVYEIDNRFCRAVAQLVLGAASVDGNEPVTARLVKPKRAAPSQLATAKMPFVAIIISRRR